MSARSSTTADASPRATPGPAAYHRPSSPWASIHASVSGQRARRARPPRAPSQHFLRTSALAAELVADAGIGPGDLVLDIGAGGGRLTAELAARARHVVAIELDPRWAAHLRGRWPNVEVAEVDILGFELPAEPFRVVANLPFDGKIGRASCREGGKIGVGAGAWDKTDE